MANNYSFLCLIGVIDHLWFHQTILFFEPISLFGPKGSTIEDQTPQSSDHQKSPRKKRTCSLSTSSPGYATATVVAQKLQKSMSYRSLGELELEEVKGFIDLGFAFKKEHLSPRMMSLVPGLQRLSVSTSKKLRNNNDDSTEIEVAPNEDKDDEKEGEVMRLYLSKAWLIKRPNLPLLNLRMPRVSAAADMKKHLKF